MFEVVVLNKVQHLNYTVRYKVKHINDVSQYSLLINCYTADDFFYENSDTSELLELGIYLLRKKHIL